MNLCGLFQKIREYIIPEDAEIQVGAFNILALCGVVVSVITAVVNGASGNWPVVGADLSGVICSLALMIYCHKTGNYRRAMILTVFIVFLGLFTALFFIQGGYHSGIPAFFVFGVVFTAFLLNGATMVVFVILEMIWYVGLCLYSYYHPLTLNNDEYHYMARVVLDMVIVSVSLATTMYCQIRVYRKKQQQLNEAILATEEANRAKSDFLAKMSHDIRTPLNTILAMNELIVSNTSSSKIREWVNDSNISGKLLLSLIDDMLDLTRIEAGRLQLLRQPWDTKQLFGEMVRVWKLQADKQGIGFEYELDKNVPDRLLGDQEAITKIINNLLSNSVKYTKIGSVRLSVSYDKDNILQIIVTDTGVGIGQEHLANIFKPFERGTQEIYKETSGSGLGLAIVKELVDAMNGSIDCTSVVNKGTTFTVRIRQDEYINRDEQLSKPDKTVSPMLNDSVASKQFIAPDIRILVVDDNAYNRKVVEGFLEPTLIKIDDVESGFEALEMIDIKEYDLVFMDLRMPKMDGTQTLMRIRSEFPDFKAPIVALTADIMNGIEEKLLEQGFSGFLAKPVSSSALIETICRFVPDKIMPIETEEKSMITTADIEKYQDMLSLYGIDIHMGLEYNGGSISEYMARAKLFEEYADEEIAKLSEASSPDMFFLLAHSVKSVAKGVGAYLLADVAETIELRKDSNFANVSIPVLIDEYKRVRTGLFELCQKVGNIYG